MTSCDNATKMSQKGNGIRETWKKNRKMIKKKAFFVLWFERQIEIPYYVLVIGLQIKNHWIIWN